MKFPGNILDIMKQAQEMQSKMAALSEQAEKLEHEASAGGGMVTVKVNGKCQIVSLTIDPQAVDPRDVKMLEDLVKAAVNEGMRKSKDSLKEELSKLAGGMPIPGIL